MRSATLEEQINHVPEPVLSRTPRPGAPFDLGAISFVFCLANAAIFTAAIARYLKSQQPYPDLVGGWLAWTNADKGFDFRVFYVFLATFALLFTLLVSLGRWLQRSSGATRSAFEPGLALALIPAAFWLGGRLATNSFGNVPVESLFSGSAVLILLFFVSRARLITTGENINRITTTSLLVLLFGFFGGLGLATVLRRVFHLPISENITIGLVSVICGFEFAAVVLATAFSATAEQIQERLRHIVFGSQLLLPMLFAVVIPPAIVENGQRIESHQSAVLLTALFLAATISWTGLIYRWITQLSSHARNTRQTLVPLAIFPIAIFVATNHTVFPTFFGDDFHTGEHLLPWQQLLDFGKLPFVGFIPVHPLMDFFVSGMNALFFDGTLANYANSRAILFAVVAALTFLTVARFAGVGPALCFGMAANVWDRLLLVPALLVILCDARLMARPPKWFLCWFFICPLALFYNPATGVALTLASLPVALIQFWQLVRKDRNALSRLMLLCGSVMIALALIPSVRAMSVGFSHFLIENARTVTLVHGIEWQPAKAQMPSVRGVLAAPLVWEVFRFSWIIALLTGGWIFLSRVGDWRNASRQALAISAIGCLFLFFLSGWTINRIDASAPSRTGEVSYLACLYILPLALLSAGRWRYTSILVFLFMIGFFQGAMADFINSGSRTHSPLTAGGLVEKPSVALTIPPQCISIEGRSLGLPNLGHLYAPKEIIDPVVSLKTALNDLLHPGETYLDLSGRLANYFYLGMPVAASCGAPWLSASTVLQDDLLAETKSRPPPVVWVAPSINHAAEGPAVRTYKVYRFFVENYLPILRNGCIFLVAPDRIVESDAVREKQIELLRYGFGNDALGLLSSAWGRSWSLLQGRFTLIQKLGVTETPISTGAGVPLRLIEGPVSGAKADFMRFDFWSNLRPTAEMEIEITWISEYGAGVARIRAANGTNLVPLGIFPEWLLSRNISDLKIQPRSPPVELKYAIGNTELLRLKD